MVLFAVVTVCCDTDDGDGGDEGGRFGGGLAVVRDAVKLSQAFKLSVDGCFQPF